MGQQANNNLIIYEGEFEEYSHIIQSVGEQAERKLNTLIEQLIVVAEEGIVEGNVHENLVTYIIALCNIQNQLGYYTTALGMDAVNYLDEIEVRDFAFYEGGRVDGWK